MRGYVHNTSEPVVDAEMLPHPNDGNPRHSFISPTARDRQQSLHNRRPTVKGPVDSTSSTEGLAKRNIAAGP